MTPAQLFRILLARRWMIVATFAAALAAGALLVTLLPKRYTATASVVVNGRSDDPLRASTASPGGGPSVVTQIDIIKRTRVASRVVSDLKLTEDDAWRQAWAKATNRTGDLSSWIASAIAGGLTVAAGIDSSVVDLQYKAEDPVFAARMANAFADAYLETMLDLRTVPAGQYAGFFEDRLRVAGEKLNVAQAKLAAFETQNDFVGGAGKIDIENARLGELSSQLALAQAQSADSVSRQTGAAGGPGSSPDVLQYPVVQDLRAKIAAQEVKLKELSSRVTPAYPAYKSAQIELDELNARLAAETRQIAGSLVTAGRVGTSRVAEIQAALAAQRQRVLSMQSLRNRDDILRKEVETAQSNFDSLTQRQSQSTLESQARQSDASLLDHASVPLSPSSPRVMLILTLAAVGGLLAGALAALIVEYFRPVLRSVEDLVDLTGLPVLTVIPNGSRLRARLGYGRSRGRAVLTH